jgi:hypothetical protein
MNERIKQLARQAKIEFTYDPTETPMRAFAECWEDELEKFAELIVLELTERLVTDTHLEYNDAVSVANYLKKHFGVEE